MRPIKLELEGFASFREKTIIEFDDVEQFVLFGPTGAGKSSILDGIVFALYGSVPRYKNNNLVAPVITQGSTEARVLLEFMAGGLHCTVARVVRRQKEGGATTKEAKWECDGQHLGLTADDLTKKVEATLGLTFDQFTKCVLLPQGEFARFLHDSPKDRQALLKRLLDAGRFEHISRKAQMKYSELSEEKTRLEGRLEEYGDATEAAVKLKTAEITALESTKTLAETLSKELAELRATWQGAQSAVDSLCAEIESLVSLSQPEGIATLAELHQQTTRAEAQAVEDQTEANHRCALAEADIAALPKRADLEALVRSYESRDNLKEQLGEAKTKLESAEADDTFQKNALATCEEAFAQAEAHVEMVKLENHSYAVASKLKPGDPCPVCAGTFKGMMQEPPAAVPAAIAKKESAERDLRAARTAAQASSTEYHIAKAKVADLQKRFEEAEGLLKGQRTRESVADLLRVLAIHEASLSEARSAAATAVKDLEKARQKLAEIKAEVTDAWMNLGLARDRFSSLAPPSLPTEDLRKAWGILTDWAHACAADKRTQVSSLEQAALQAHQVLQTADSRMSEILRNGGVVRDKDEDALSAVKRKLDRLSDERGLLKERIAKAAELREQLKFVKHQVKLYGELRKHLKVTGFESWYLNRSFSALAELASKVLHELTGRYSLNVTDDNDFQIVDGSNADERRSVRTLSGGETFLASLALALALSDQVEGTGAKLESLFIDEGFGSLDAETLETVSSAIEELRSRGRMIGVITHVQDFAERIPVRYMVSRSPSGSKVEKVYA